VLKDLGTHPPQRSQPSAWVRPSHHVPGWLRRQRSGRATPAADIVVTTKHRGNKGTSPVHSAKTLDALAKGPTALTPDDRFVRVAVRKRRSRFGGWDRLTAKARPPKLTWPTSRKVHNKLMHALNGNTAAGANVLELCTGTDAPTAQTDTTPTPANAPGAPSTAQQGDVGDRANRTAAGDEVALDTPIPITGSDGTPASTPTGAPLGAWTDTNDDDTDGSTPPDRHDSVRHRGATTYDATENVRRSAGEEARRTAPVTQTAARTHDPDSIAATTVEAADDTPRSSDTDRSVTDAMQGLRLTIQAIDRSPMTAGPNTSGPVTQTSVDWRVTDHQAASGPVHPSSVSTMAVTATGEGTSFTPVIPPGHTHGHAASRDIRSISPESPHMDPAPSAAGGTADRCEHRRGRFRCRNEVWACCIVPECGRSLCARHFGTAPPTHTYDPSASRCHEHGALRMCCPCPECRPHRTAAHGPGTQLTAAAASRQHTGHEPTHPLTTITILSDEDLARIAAHRAQALHRRSMRVEDTHSARVRDALNTISANREAALARKRRLQEAQAPPDATRRRLHNDKSRRPCHAIRPHADRVVAACGPTTTGGLPE
jgi:hypothetical protein